MCDIYILPFSKVKKLYYSSKSELKSFKTKPIANNVLYYNGVPYWNTFQSNDDDKLAILICFKNITAYLKCVEQFTSIGDKGFFVYVKNTELPAIESVSFSIENSQKFFRIFNEVNSLIEHWQRLTVATAKRTKVWKTFETISNMVGDRFETLPNAKETLDIAINALREDISSIPTMEDVEEYDDTALLCDIYVLQNNQLKTLFQPKTPLTKPKTHLTKFEIDKTEVGVLYSKGRHDFLGDEKSNDIAVLICFENIKSYNNYKETLRQTQGNFYLYVKSENSKAINQFDNIGDFANAYKYVAETIAKWHGLGEGEDHPKLMKSFKSISELIGTSLEELHNGVSAFDLATDALELDIEYMKTLSRNQDVVMDVIDSRPALCDIYILQFSKIKQLCSHTDDESKLHEEKSILSSLREFENSEEIEEDVLYYGSDIDVYKLVNGNENDLSILFCFESMKSFVEYKEALEKIEKPAFVLYVKAGDLPGIAPAKMARFSVDSPQILIGSYAKASSLLGRWQNLKTNDKSRGEKFWNTFAKINEIVGLSLKTLNNGKIAFQLALEALEADIGTMREASEIFKGVPSATEIDDGVLEMPNKPKFRLKNKEDEPTKKTKQEKQEKSKQETKKPGVNIELVPSEDEIKDELYLNSLTDDLSVFFRLACGETKMKFVDLFIKTPKKLPVRNYPTLEIASRAFAIYMQAMSPFAVMAFAKLSTEVSRFSEQKLNMPLLIHSRYSLDSNPLPPILVAAATLCGLFMRESSIQNPNRGNTTKHASAESAKLLNDALEDLRKYIRRDLKKYATVFKNIEHNYGRKKLYPLNIL